MSALLRDGRLRLLRLGRVRRRRRSSSSSRSSLLARAPQGRARAGALDATEPDNRSAATAGRRMKPRHRRFAWIGAGVLLLGVAAALVLNAFQSNLVFFFSPTTDRRERGAAGTARSASAAWSWRRASTREPDGLTVRFNVTDTAQDRAGRLHRHPSRPVQGRQRRRGAGPDRPRRRVPRDRSAREARRELHAARGRRRGRQGAQARAAMEKAAKTLKP